MDALHSMRTFRAVAENGSFVDASERLKQSPAMTSKHVMKLEERLGVRLLNRNSRNVSLTDAGREYLAQLSQILDALDDAEAAISATTHQPKGLLRISAPVWVACAGFTAALAEFQSMYPEVRLELDLTGKLVDLIEDGVDVALRVSASPGEHYIARPIAEIRFDWVASPEYLKKHGKPSTFSELMTHSVLWYSGMPTEIELTERPEAGQKKLKIEPVLRSGNETLLYHSALQHMGIVLLPQWTMADDLATGRLVRVFDEHTGYSRTINAVYSSRKHLSSKVRVFIDFIRSKQMQ